MKDGFTEMSTHMLGEGGSGFYQTVDAIKQSGYEGWIFVENYYDQDRLGAMRNPYGLLRRDVETIKKAFEP